MQKAIREINSIKEWQELTKSGMVHKDKEAHIDIPGHTISITQSLFYSVVLKGSTRAIINLPAESEMKVCFKDNSMGIIKRGAAMAKGESKAIALGRSTLELTHRATGYLFDEARAMLHQESTAYLFDECNATAQNKSTIYVGEYANADAEDEAKIFDMGTTGILSSISTEDKRIIKGNWLLKRKFKTHRKKAKKAHNELCVHTSGVGE